MPGFVETGVVDIVGSSSSGRIQALTFPRPAANISSSDTCASNHRSSNACERQVTSPRSAQIEALNLLAVGADVCLGSGAVAVDVMSNAFILTASNNFQIMGRTSVVRMARMVSLFPTRFNHASP
jgi:hypothetical protein